MAVAPVALAFRAWLRRRWRAGAGLALLLGLAGGVALTAAAGARRTDTAYPRLLAASGAASVQVIPGCTGLRGFYPALARLPPVAALSTEVIYSLALPGRPLVLAGRPAGTATGTANGTPTGTATGTATGTGAGPARQLEVLASPDGSLGTAPTGCGSWPGGARPAPPPPTW